MKAIFAFHLRPVEPPSGDGSPYIFKGVNRCKEIDASSYFFYPKILKHLIFFSPTFQKREVTKTENVSKFRMLKNFTDFRATKKNRSFLKKKFPVSASELDLEWSVVLRKHFRPRGKFFRIISLKVEKEVPPTFFGRRQFVASLSWSARWSVNLTFEQSLRVRISVPARFLNLSLASHTNLA